jgi:hypothetical protein
MSKGNRRRNAIALKNIRRAPEEWFDQPVETYRAKKNKVVVRIPARKSRGRNV